MKKTFGQELIGRLTGFAEALESNEPVTPKFTCRHVVLNLKPAAYDPKRVKATRRLLNLSQVLFARFLGVAPQTVRAWEQGTNTPRDSACRLMDEIRHDPKYWTQRVRELAREKKSTRTVVG